MDKLVRSVFGIVMASVMAVLLYYMVFGVNTTGFHYVGFIPSIVRGMELSTSEYYRTCYYDKNHTESHMFDKDNNGVARNWYSTK